MLTVPIMFFDSGISIPEIILTFEEQDKFALEFQYLTFENQSKDSLLPPFTQLTFENQDSLLPAFTQLTFENQLIGALE